jgi:hypothetical protein
VVALILGLLPGSLMPRHALAAFTTCTSDPVIILSNGATLDVDASIADSSSDVTSVVYNVHGPAGTYVVALASVGPADQVNYSGDDAPNTYDTSTTVSTGLRGVSVTASTKALSALGVTVGSASLSGQSGQSLHIHVSGLL